MPYFSPTGSILSLGILNSVTCVPSICLSLTLGASGGTDTDLAFELSFFGCVGFELNKRKFGWGKPGKKVFIKIGMCIAYTQKKKKKDQLNMAVCRRSPDC